MAVELPQDLKDLLVDAETKLQDAKVKDDDHLAAAQAADAAATQEQMKAAVALSAHQDANVSATAALAALRTHFGI